MLTFFTTAKSFRAHIGIIQRNALQSWKALHPGIEIILFGNDEGAAEAAQKFGLRHEPHVECNELGTKRLDYLFARAQAIARHEILCYINCDIILMQDFCRAVGRVSRLAGPRFARLRFANSAVADRPPQSGLAPRPQAHRRLDRLLRVFPRRVRAGHAAVCAARLLG